MYIITQQFITWFIKGTGVFLSGSHLNTSKYIKAMYLFDISGKYEVMEYVSRPVHPVEI